MTGRVFTARSDGWADKLRDERTPDDLAQFEAFKQGQAQEAEAERFRQTPREKLKARLKRWRAIRKDHVALYYLANADRIKARVRKWRVAKKARKGAG